MPIKSKAQRRKFAELLVEGKITPETFEEWNRGAGGKDLPERVHPQRKTKRKAAKKKVARSKARRKPARKKTAPKKAAPRKPAPKKAARRTTRQVGRRRAPR